MRFFRQISILILSYALFFAPLLSASNLPERPTGFVTDQARILDFQTRSQLEAVLSNLEKKTQAEVAVVTVSSLGDEPIENVAVQLFQSFGVGKKDKDNGVLFLIAPNDRQMRIEVGYGLEGVITDALSSQIIQGQVAPAFRQGELPKGVALGALSLASLIAQDAGVTLEAPQGAPRPGPVQKKKKLTLFDIILTVLFLIVFIPLLIRHPWLIFFLLSSGRGGYRSGGGFGGGFGGFGGGSSGGGGASGGW